MNDFDESEFDEWDEDESEFDEWDNGNLESESPLQEVRVGWKQGRPVQRRFSWQEGRVRAMITSNGVWIKRVFGTDGEGVPIFSHSDLLALADACRDWDARRDQWAAYWETSGGTPEGHWSKHYYIAPGAPEETAQHLCSHFSRRPLTVEGKEPTGKEEYRWLSEPIPVSPRIAITAEVWHVGETIPGLPPEDFVGVLYKVPASVRFETDNRKEVSEFIDKIHELGARFPDMPWQELEQLAAGLESRLIMFTGIGGYIIGGRRAKEKLASNGATLGFEKQLWKAADALRRNMDAEVSSG
jgi:hypothetical protein